MATFDDFQKIDIRVGKVMMVEEYTEAKKPSYKLTIDFGKEIGLKRSVGQFPKNYTKSQLTGKQVLCVVNFPPRQIGKAVSEVLTLGVPDRDGEAILIIPEREVPVGGRLF